MKLSQKEVTQLYNIIHTATLAGIDSIVFQETAHNHASGLSKDSVAIIVKENLPVFPQKIGIGRLSVLKKRLDLLIGENGLTVEPKESDRGEIIQLEFVAGKTKTQYRCTSSAGIKAPREISDGGTLGIVTINKAQMAMILNSIRVMGAAQITLIIKQDGLIMFEVTDSNDRFTVELDTPINRDTADETDSAVFYYQAPIFSSLLKSAIGDDESLSMVVGISGTIQFNLNSCEMSIFAQVNGDQ